jgi:hypothetical protein
MRATYGGLRNLYQAAGHSRRGHPSRKLPISILGYSIAGCIALREKAVPLGAIPAGSIHPAAKKAPSSRDGALTKGIHSQRWQRVRSVWPFYDGLTATR